MSRGMGGHQATRGQSEVWLTPPYILGALGPFDLDPCAAPGPRPWPTAARHITLPDDGLSTHWEGRVWLNPPYGPSTRHWVERLADHGRGTALVFARTDTAWFVDHVWPYASGLLFLRGRLRFYRPDGKLGPENGGAPSVLVAYGPDDADRLGSSGLAGSYVPIRSGPVNAAGVQGALEFER